jgi:hypothetical protein
VRGGRRIPEFLVVASPAPDDVVPFRGREVFEDFEVVRPLLDGDETRTVESRARICEYSSGARVVAGLRSGILLLDVDGPQVEFSVDPRRAPVEAARDRSGESEESIDNAVFGARHAQELGVERV